MSVEEVNHLRAIAQRIQLCARTDSTRKQYWSHFNRLCAFCEAASLPLPPPITLELLVLYCIDYVHRGNKATSLSAIRTALLFCNNELGGVPLSKVELGQLDLTIRGLIRLDARPPEPAIALTRDKMLPLLSALVACVGGSRAVQLCFACILAQQAVLRPGELLKLRRKDFVVLPDGVRLCIRGDKTHKQGGCSWLSVGFTCDNSDMNLRVSLVSYAKVVSICSMLPDDWLFPNLSDRAAPMTYHYWVTRFQLAAQSAGLPRYKLHGLRAGGATDMIHAGVPVDVVMAFGRWSGSSLAAMRYVRASEREMLEAADAVVRFQSGEMSSSERLHRLNTQYAAVGKVHKARR